MRCSCSLARPNKVWIRVRWVEQAYIRPYLAPRFLGPLTPKFKLRSCVISFRHSHFSQTQPERKLALQLAPIGQPGSSPQIRPLSLRPAACLLRSQPHQTPGRPLKDHSRRALRNQMKAILDTETNPHSQTKVWIQRTSGRTLATSNRLSSGWKPLQLPPSL